MVAGPARLGQTLSYTTYNMTFSNIERPYKVRLADAETARGRIDICKACDKYDGTVCTLCNCIMKQKVFFVQATCGEGKW